MAPKINSNQHEAGKSNENASGTDPAGACDVMQGESSQSNFESDDQRGTRDSAMEPLPYCHTASQITASIAQRAAALGQSRCMRCRKWLPITEFTATNCARCHAYNVARAARGRKRTKGHKSSEFVEAEGDIEPVNVQARKLVGGQDDVDIDDILDEEQQGSDEDREGEEDMNDVDETDDDCGNACGDDSEDADDGDEDEDDNGEVEDSEGEEEEVVEGDVIGGSHDLENHPAPMDYDYDDESDDGGWDGEEGYFAGWYELCMS